MPNSAPGFAGRPDYRVDLLPEGRRVTVKFGGMTIADSGEALRVEETGHGPVHYLSQKDVRLDLMRPTEHHTRCRRLLRLLPQPGRFDHGQLSGRPACI